MAESLEDIPGVGPAIAKKLRSGGHLDPSGLAVAPIIEVMERTGIAFKTALKVVEGARELTRRDIVTAKELLERRKSILRCTTGCGSLDRLLGGGFQTQATTELVGPFGVGKTQICFVLCVTCQLPIERGGLGGGAVYIDTEGTFHPERVKQIAEAWGMDADEVLRNITVGRAYTSDHQVILVDHLAEHVDMSRVRLLVVNLSMNHSAAASQLWPILLALPFAIRM